MRAAARAILIRTAAVVAIASCDNDAEVDVRARVGGADDPQQVARALVVVARERLPALRETAAAAPVVETTHPPRTRGDLDDLVAAIRKGALDDVGGPARRIAAADPALWPRVRTLLLAERKAPKPDYRALLAAIGGDVPNRYGHFDRAWKRSHGFSVKLSTDWFEDLLVLPRGRVSAGLTGVFRDCVLQTALLRAAASIGRERLHTEAVVAALLDAAFVHEGTFRDEVGRALLSIGDEAVPHLVLAAIVPKGARDDDPRRRRAEYAATVLDRMDRLVPERAEAALQSDPRRLAALVRAWGVARRPDAAELVLRHVDAATPALREAARGAFDAYVDAEDGEVHRVVRLLGGGTAHARAYLSGRERAALAVRDALVHVAPDVLELPCDVRRDNGSIDEHCRAQPRRYHDAYYRALDQRRSATMTAAIDAALAERDVDRAVAALDRVLAEASSELPTARLIPVYREAAALAWKRGEQARAAALWRKTARLAAASDPALASSLRTKALVAEARSEGIDEAGREMLLRTAEAIAPEDPAVLAARDEMRGAESPEIEIARGRVLGGVGLFGIVMACVGGIAGGVRRRIRAGSAGS
jgi:hypothetical protein